MKAVEDALYHRTVHTRVDCEVSVIWDLLHQDLTGQPVSHQYRHPSADAYLLPDPLNLRQTAQLSSHLTCVLLQLSPLVMRVLPHWLHQHRRVLVMYWSFHCSMWHDRTLDRTLQHLLMYFCNFMILFSPVLPELWYSRPPIAIDVFATLLRH